MESRPPRRESRTCYAAATAIAGGLDGRLGRPKQTFSTRENVFLGIAKEKKDTRGIYWKEEERLYDGAQVAPRRAPAAATAIAGEG